MTTNPQVSVIIPTYNEADYLPQLLESIKLQTRKPLEVIVADANSADKTAEIAKEHDALVVQGGLPAVGRNRGARQSRGDLLLFLDSDVVLPEDFIELAISEFDERYLELANSHFKPSSKVRIDLLFFDINNLAMDTLQELYPVTPGAALLTTRRLFNRLNGFNESLKVDEDNDFGIRARKIARFGIIKSTHCFISVRRFEKEGRLRLLNKYFQQGIFRQLKGLGIDRSIEYDFGRFASKRDLDGAEKFLEDVLANLENFQKDSKRHVERAKELISLGQKGK